MLSQHGPISMHKDISVHEVNPTQGGVAEWLEHLAYILDQWGDLGSNPGHRHFCFNSWTLRPVAPL
jgi:hypothetical protein